jgi:hypothetical protein
MLDRIVTMLVIITSLADLHGFMELRAVGPMLLVFLEVLVGAIFGFDLAEVTRRIGIRLPSPGLNSAAGAFEWLSSEHDPDRHSSNRHEKNGESNER